MAARQARTLGSSLAECDAVDSELDYEDLG